MIGASGKDPKNNRIFPKFNRSFHLPETEKSVTIIYLQGEIFLNKIYVGKKAAKGNGTYGFFYMIRY